MNNDSKAIIILCSYLCVGENVFPYEPAEWTKLAERLLNNGITPFELLSFSNSDLKNRLNFGSDEIERMNRLVERSGSITFEVERYENMGIHVMTRADKCYPKALKNKLGKSCPPIFYYVGNPSLTEARCIGFVGSRSIGADDASFTEKTVRKCNDKGYGIVSGGAKGIDSAACAAAIHNDSVCIEYVSDSLEKKAKEKPVIDAVLENLLLVLSVSKPDAGFRAGIAMMRNKYIYSQSDGTVVVKSDYNKGGTWSGAIENLKSKRSITLCWNNPKYIGNAELINRGAVPIDEEWEADIYENNTGITANAASEQFSLFAI